MSKNTEIKQDTTTNSNQQKPICGVVRPIADMGPSYPAKHWRDVHGIIAEAAELAGYQVRLVSESDTAGVILAEIVTNLYQDPIIVADVSARNPNVMFELGMRLAFEKPAIIIKDDETDFAFDISSVKHITYPRSLRYQDVIDFKSNLSASIISTLQASKDSNYRGYLQQFGPIKVTELGSNNIDINELAYDIQEIKRSVSFMRHEISARDPALGSSAVETVVHLDIPERFLPIILDRYLSLPGVIGYDFDEKGIKLKLQTDNRSEMADLRNHIRMSCRDLQARIDIEDREARSRSSKS